MKSLICLATGLALLATANAGNLTEENAARAQAVIDAAVEAHGNIEDLETLHVEHDTITYAVDQSRGTEPPWDEGASAGLNAIDLANSVFVTHGSFESGGFEGLGGTIINGEDSYQLDLRAGTASRISEPDYATTSGPFVRVTAPLLVRTLHDRAANAHYLGEVEISGAEYDVVAFSMTTGPAVSMYFDRKSHLLRRSERLIPNIGLARYDFAGYETIGGVAVNRKFRFYLNGDLNIERENIAIRVNEPLDDLLTVDDSLAAIPEQTPEPLTRQEVADGVWHIGGSGTYAMFVDMGDYVFAAGGTAGIPDRIASLREVVGDKPIRYGMLTHHHFDHVLGVAPYVAEGATIIGATAHEAIARRAAGNNDALRFEGVDGQRTFESGGRVIEIIDIGPTAHTEHLLVAYLPEEGILFEADHFAMPRVGPVPPAVTSTRTFAEALARTGIPVRQILSAHSPRAATMDDLQRALEAEIFQASR